MSKKKPHLSKYKCEHCMKQFGTLKEGHEHHDTSRHKMKERKIVEIGGPSVKKVKESPQKIVKKSVTADKIPRVANENGIKKRKTATKVKKRKVEPPKLLPLEPTFHYKCRTCHEWFEQIDALKTHQKKTHNSVTTKPYVSDKRNGTELYTNFLVSHYCLFEQCGFYSYTLEELILHSNKHYPTPTSYSYLKYQPGKSFEVIELPVFKCSQCKIKPNILLKMKQHWQNKHSFRPLRIFRIYGPETEESYQCDQCDSIFKLKTLLHYHKEFKHSYN